MGDGPPWSQGGADVRFEWGPDGGAQIARGAAVVVVVDVLSFTTTVGVALAGGAEVLPSRWHDGAAARLAAERGARLAVGRLEARALASDDVPPASLSPADMVRAAGAGALRGDRIVLPSPNGSTIVAALSGGDARVVAASLRTRAAVSRWLVRSAPSGPVAVVAAGERWPDGPLRPAVEDLWGAGSVVEALVAEQRRAGRRELRLSPEAGAAVAAFAAVRSDLAANLAGCASGLELAAAGFADDVVVAAGLDADDVVPLLVGDALRAAT
ncbi:2-phosphosulfolactate phosphatase [Luteimicrobium sp. NPDC057192]|uniref:2-phosphosulfolactate phosphatase n=1 Tax=Luteimicrobium sp. NPDC057192 TaxID=3346042 RepID=UPI00363296EE